MNLLENVLFKYIVFAKEYYYLRNVKQKKLIEKIDYLFIYNIILKDMKHTIINIIKRKLIKTVNIE